MSTKVSLVALLGLLIAAMLTALRPWKRNGAGRLVNAEGVGPSHIRGVPRGEDQVAADGSGEPTSVAGRIAGSISPE